MLSVISIIEDTMVDGPGFRTAVYAAGCKHQCKGCHNPQSWDFNAGCMMSTDQIMQIIKQDSFANVSFSGGDPMYQPEGFTELAQAIREQTNKTIWCWTGFSFEMLLRMPKQRQLLELIDVLVDGPYIKEQRDTDLLFRGSRNQRLIDVKASLNAGKVILYYDPMTMVS